MAEFTRPRGKRQEDNGLGSVLDLLLANARLVLGVTGAAVLAIATLAVKRVRLVWLLLGLRAALLSDCSGGRCTVNLTDCSPAAPWGLAKMLLVLVAAPWVQSSGGSCPVGHRQPHTPFSWNIKHLGYGLPSRKMSWA